jgi:hypothetical protein
MFKIIQLALQVVFKPYMLSDKASCKKFIENILSLVKPIAGQSKTEIDDKIVQHLEYILKTEALFDWFYQLVVDQFSTEEVIFESVDDSFVVETLNSSNEPVPEAISPIVIISLVTQIISLINALKKMKTE